MLLTMLIMEAIMGQAIIINSILPTTMIIQVMDSSSRIIIILIKQTTVKLMQAYSAFQLIN
jgi:hypothetical protein